MDLSIQDETREFSFYDASELLRIVCNNETLLKKKRRWLQLPAYISRGSKLVRRKTPKFLAEKFVPESHVRNDEVSCDIVRTSVGKSFGLFCNNQSKNHVINCFSDPFNAHTMEDKERILSITKDLTNAALYSVACIVTGNNLKFKKTRPELIKVVKDDLKNYLSDANRKPDELSQLSEIYKNPSNYLQNNQQTVTPVTQHLLLSISKTLERLDELNLNLQELTVIYRKLRGVKVEAVPQFPPVTKVHKAKQTILERVKKLCKKYLSNLQEGQEIPKELADGLTVVILSLYYRLDHTDVPICEFRPFSEEVMCTQMEILHALKSLRNLQEDELDTLIRLIDPTGMVPRSSFRIFLKRYMVECLFVCDEIRIPKEAQRVVDFFNTNRDNEVEAVLNVSCYLKSVVTNLLPEEVREGCDNAQEVASEGKENWFFENNDFKFSGSDFFFSSVGQGLGEDLEETSSNCISKSVNSTKSTGSSTNSCDIPKKSSEKQDGASQTCSSKTGREIELNEICDETAVVARKLIGHLIDGFLKFEKTVPDELTRSDLTDGSPNINNHRVLGAETKSNATAETNILLDALEKVLPSFPKSSLTKVKRLLDAGLDPHSEHKDSDCVQTASKHHSHSAPDRDPCGDDAQTTSKHCPNSALDSDLDRDSDGAQGSAQTMPRQRPDSAQMVPSQRLDSAPVSMCRSPR